MNDGVARRDLGEGVGPPWTTYLRHPCRPWLVGQMRGRSYVIQNPGALTIIRMKKPHLSTSRRTVVEHIRECVPDQFEVRLICKLSDGILAGPSPAEAGQCNRVRLNGGHSDGIWGPGIVFPVARTNQQSSLTSARISTHSICFRRMTGPTSKYTPRAGGPLDPENMERWRSFRDGRHWIITSSFTSTWRRGMSATKFEYRRVGASGARLADRIVYDVDQVL
jgi:hypothetical protein